MKFDDDGPLKSYLAKNLQPLTRADPKILANYVAALLKNNKPKKELQKLCNDQLQAFLGDDTKPFVSKLFHDIEEGALAEAVDVSVVPTGETGAAEHKTPSNRSGGSEPEESSDDEDDDRNHKHRRRVSRSRSSDKEDERSHHRKRSRSTDNGHYSRDSHRHYEHRRPYRHREHSLASRIVADGTVHGGVRGGGFRGDRFPGGGRSRGWVALEQHGFADGEFGPGLLQTPSGSSLFPGRVVGGRGHPQAQWGAFNVIPNGSLEHVLPLGAGRGTVNPLNIPLARPRCLDFEERGFCLRGDLCPMEHGANRIVVDDVQSLSKLNLPMSNSRNGGADSSAGAEMAGRGARVTREGDEANPTSNASDTYDPDQPLWGKDQSDKVRQYQRHEWENASREAGLDEAGKGGVDSGVSVWDRIEYRRQEGPPRSNAERPPKKQRMDGQTGTEEVANGNGNGNGHHVEGTVASEKRAEGAGGTGGRDRAQRTLYVRCIPTESNKTDALKAHFQKFGEVLDIRKPSHHSDRAFVQFARAEDAQSALASPEAVLGNRFIRVSWANRDNRAEPSSGKHGSNVQVAAQVDRAPTNVTPPGVKKQVPPPVNGVAQAQKKQEELEHMKEEIRKKQEALAAKRDEFKRKLEKLAKQTPAAPTAENREDSRKTSEPQAKTPKSSTRTGTAAQQVGVGRYKLDNRTPVFRILTPPPTALSDIPAMKEHFAPFGELSDLSVEQVDGNDTIKVCFAARRDAERAFIQGKVWQGQSLQLSWVNVPASPSPNAPRPAEATTTNGSAADAQAQEQLQTQESA